jgi:hypothetical protein
VRWELRRMVFHGRAAAHKPNILPLNAKRLIKWCKERRCSTVDNWKCVIWGDELHYTMWQSDGRVWRRWHYSVGVLFMEWTWLLVILRGNLNTEGCKDILTCCILSTVEDEFSDEDCPYQHDNAPCHKARSVRQWSVDNKVPEMDCPPQSPDLNPVEYLWGELELRLQSRPQGPAPLTARATALQEEWSAILPETFRHLVESLPGRVWLSMTGMCVRGKLGSQFRLGVRIFLIRIVYMNFGPIDSLRRTTAGCQILFMTF